MISKIKKLIAENRNRQEEQLLKLKELEWAHIYHDSIRGKKWVEELPLNVGRWAGNYSFFYVLNRVLMDFKPKSILDLGLGESSKFISAYLENHLLDSKHTIVEQNEEWIKVFQEKVSLSNRSNVVYCPIKEIEIKGYMSNSYDGFTEKITEKFDFYIIDGPFGSDRYSRYDIISLIEGFDADAEFIILLDDTNRQGERDTLKDILQILKIKGIHIFVGYYEGNKSNTVIASQIYKFAAAL
jgi:hypothetical protein